MRPLIRLLLLYILFIVPVAAQAQTMQYQQDSGMKVMAYGRQQTLAWCGGFNNPQFAMGDLNHDGLQDLVVYESFNSLRTFINKGTAGNPKYVLEPQYALNFPPIYDYLILADYNCDGIPDLFHQGNTGFCVYKGYYNAASQLCFTYYMNIYYSNDSYAGGTVNAFNNPGDIPAVVDVDNDGDLDLVSYDIIGGHLNLYKNMRVELGLPCDSIHIDLEDRCWGRCYQGFYRTHELEYSCSEDGLHKEDAHKTTHSGNTPCLFDWDMDGDYDYLDGSISFNEMTFLKNGRVEYGGPDSMVYQDTTWQTDGKPVELPIWPAAFNVDIDQDGKKDLLISPNAGSISENYHCIWYYKNFSTPGLPDWRFQSDSFLTDMSIDAGTAAYPMVFDFNKDGRPDMFIGSDGYRQADGTLRSRISYYLNTSTADSPSFTLQTTDFLNINAYNFQGTAPAAGDIDNDGKADLVLGHTDGTLSYLKNMAASDTVAPDWQMQQLQLTDMNGDTINTGGYAAPFIYDIDKDGKPDLVIGSIYGYIQYYRNISATPGSIKLQLINTRLGHIKADPHHNIGCYSTPFIGKIDSSGTDYLLLGSNSGNIYRFTGFQSGDTTATYTVLDSQYSAIDTTYSVYEHPGLPYGIYGNSRTAPAAADLLGDGGSEMLVGNIKGGVEYYKRKKLYYNAVPDIQQNLQVTLYPNPVKDELNITYSGTQAPVTLTLLNMEGQRLYTAMASGGHSIISTSAMPSGMYICLLQNADGRSYSKFTIVR